MNRSVLARIGPVLFAFYLIAYAAFFAWGLIRFSNETYLTIFTTEVAARQALLNLLTWIVPITAGAVVTALSLAAGESKRGGPILPFSRIVASTVVTFLVLAAGFTALSETLGAGSSRRLDELAWQSRLAREYEKLAVKARGLGDWSRAAEYDRLYLRIDPENGVIEEHRTTDEVNAERGRADARPAAASPVKPTDGVDAGSLVKKAQAYFDDGDWFSALWYARQAGTIDPRRTDATRLAARALGKIEAEQNKLPPDPKDPDRSYALNLKAAFEALNQDDPVTAYYAFAKLAALRPQNPDAKEFLGKAEQQLRLRQFFTDDAAIASALPGAERLLWFADGAGTVAMWAGRMVAIEREVGTERWFFDLEAIRLNADGGVAWHLGAVSARLSDDEKTLLLKGVGRNDPKKVLEPVYFAGTRAAAERNILPLGISIDDLSFRSLDPAPLAGRGMAELWRIRGSIARSEPMHAAISVELATRAAAPFTFLVASLFAVAFGWSLRGRWTGRAPAVAYLAAPVIVVAAGILSQLYVHAHRVLLGFAVTSLSLTAGAITLGALELVLVAAALAVLAGQTSR